MKSRLVVAALLPHDVVTRAREEFDALVVDGDDDMTADETVQRRHAASGRCHPVHQHAAANSGDHRRAAPQRARRRYQQRRL